MKKFATMAMACALLASCASSRQEKAHESQAASAWQRDSVSYTARDSAVRLRDTALTLEGLDVWIYRPDSCIRLPLPDRSRTGVSAVRIRASRATVAHRDSAAHIVSVDSLAASGKASESSGIVDRESVSESQARTPLPSWLQILPSWVVLLLAVALFIHLWKSSKR